MKKLLLPFLFLSCFAQAQWLFVPDFTLCLAQAPNSILDSTIVMGNSTNALIQSNIYTHDSRENLLEKKFHDVSNNQNDLSTFVYDANDSVVQKTFSSGQPTPTFTMAALMTRNALKQVEHDTVLYLSGSQYTLYSASTYSYGVTGNVTEILMDGYNSSWSPWSRRHFTLNGAGKPTQILLENWVNSAWVNSSQINSTYNNNGDQTDRVLQFWNTSSSAWKNNSRERYAYTGSHLDTLTDYTWNNAWIKNSRNTYSPAGTLDSMTIDTWNGTQWEGDKRYVRTWSQGKLISVVEKGFNSTWQTTWKHEYIYDSNGNHIKTNFYSYFVGATSDWVLLIVTNHYYRASTVGIAEHSLNDTKTYPVPSSSMLYFDSALPVKSGTVYTTSGSEAIRFEGASVNLSAVMPGVYYIKLLLEDGNYRMVKAVRE